MVALVPVEPRLRGPPPSALAWRRHAHR